MLNERRKKKEKKKILSVRGSNANLTGHSGVQASFMTNGYEGFNVRGRGITLHSLGIEPATYIILSWPRPGVKYQPQVI